MKLRSQSRVLWIALSAVVAVTVIVLLLIPSEPSYRGKGLSEYLIAFSNDGYQISSEPPYEPIGVFAPSAERAEAWEAIPQFGDKAIPTYVRLAAARDSKLSFKLKGGLRWLASKVHRLHLRFPTAGEKQNQAVSAFIRLGPRGTGAAPQLLPLLEEQSTARAAIFSLAFIRPEREADVLSLTNVLWRSDQSLLKIDVMAALAVIGRKSQRIVPALTNCLRSTNDQVSAMAAVALSRLGDKRAETAAFIAGRLSSASGGPGYVAPPLEMYLWALGELGGAGTNELSMIAPLTKSGSARVRDLAEVAIKRIEGRLEPIAPPNDGPAASSEKSGAAGEGRHR